MRGARCVAARTRSRRADAGAAVKLEPAADGDPPAAPAPSPARGRGRGRGRPRGRWGSGEIPRPPPAPGARKRWPEIPVIVLDDDEDEEDEAGGGEREESCGGSGDMHAAPPPSRGRARAGYPVSARTRSRTESCHFSIGAGGVSPSGAVGSSSSSVSMDQRAAEKSSGSPAARGEGSAESSGGGAIGSSEAAVSVHGGKEDGAEVVHCVGDAGVAADSCCWPSSLNGSAESNLVSSGDSLSTRGDVAGGEVESGGSLASETGTKQMASSEGDHRSGEGAVAGDGGVASIGESGSKSSHSRGIHDSQFAATGTHGKMGESGIELRNCIARRTRSKIFGDKYKVVDYTAYFEKLESSDSEGDGGVDSDSEETCLLTPLSPVSLLSPSSSSWTSEGNGETKHSDEDWSEDETGDNCERDAEPVVKKRRFSCNNVLFSTGRKEGNVDDSVSADNIGVAHHNLKDGKSKDKGKAGTVNDLYCKDGDKFVSSPARNFGGNDLGSDRKTSDEKPEKIILSDSDDCFEGETTPMSLKKQEMAKQHVVQTGKSKKKKRVQTLKGDSLFKIFIDTIWGKAETLPEELLSRKVETTAVKNEEALPLIFSFGDEDLKPVEKSEYEKDLDELWAEFDFVLNSNDIGSYTPCECEDEEMDVEEDENHRSCVKGGHQFILDEQIGIKCKLCSFVRLEIRYILPSLAAERSEGMFGGPSLGNQENVPLFDGLFASKNQKGRGDGFEPSEGTVWDLIPGVKSTLYPHQQEAFEFMWRNLAGDIFLNNLKKSACYDGLGGCVISHAPGTGKSRLTIVFLQAFLRVFPECRPVIVAPRGMLLTWKKEFEKWKIDIPVHVLNEHQFYGTEDDVALRLVHGKHRKRQWSRVVKLYSWDKGRSILALSYCLFEKLVGSLNKEGTVSADLGKILLDRPDLFVFDEGHTPRNERSLIWKALGKIKTERRIILSGTPFQNNFGELYNTFCLVRPKFGDKISRDTSKNCQRREFMMENEENTFPAKDEGRGKWASLTNSITDERLEELRTMMKPFVHVHNGSSLRCLPGLKDCLIVLDPLPQQKNILEVVEDIRSDTTFAMEYKISLASVHPSLLTACTLSEKEASDIDILKLESIKLNPNEGVKTRFVMELVRLCQPLNERVLVFSQYIEPLDLIIKQLEPPFGWKEGTEILKMDGKIRPRHRQSLIDDFNNPKSNARVLLASIKACCEGISLTGASRVVLLDVVWNPSVERQAISRAYRLGQDKFVYIYHLITYGTREGDKYYKQVEKDRLSKLVFSSADGYRNVQDDSLSVSEDKILKEMVGHEKLKGMFKRILYQPKESNLIDAFMF